jgi:hypothetical protein
LFDQFADALEGPSVTQAFDEIDGERPAIENALETNQVNLNLPSAFAEGRIGTNVRGPSPDLPLMRDAHRINAFAGDEGPHLLQIGRRETERLAASLAAADESMQTIGPLSKMTGGTTVRRIAAASHSRAKVVTSPSRPRPNPKLVPSTSARASKRF